MREIKSKEVILPVGKVRLKALLGLPPAMRGVVVFAHGSGSGRLSPRNNFVAQVLQYTGMATLLVDLLAFLRHDERRLDGN
jgi:putative phosphoribosyl transferase